MLYYCCGRCSCFFSLINTQTIMMVRMINDSFSSLCMSVWVFFPSNIIINIVFQYYENTFRSWQRKEKKIFLFSLVIECVWVLLYYFYYYHYIPQGWGIILILIIIDNIINKAVIIAVDVVDVAVIISILMMISLLFLYIIFLDLSLF